MGSAWFLFVAVVASMSQEARSDHLFFTSSKEDGSGGLQLRSLDLSASPPKESLLVETDFGPKNPGHRGAPGLCNMNGLVYWADSTTGTVHSAKVANGKATMHDATYIANLVEPQGLACDASTGRVYVLDNQGGLGHSGIPTILYREHDGPTKTLNITNKGSISSLRSISLVKRPVSERDQQRDGVDLWVAGDGGVFVGLLNSDDSITFWNQTAVKLSCKGVAVDPSPCWDDDNDFNEGYFWSTCTDNNKDWSVFGELLDREDDTPVDLINPRDGDFFPLKYGNETSGSLIVGDSCELYWFSANDQAHLSIMYWVNRDNNGSQKKVYDAPGLNGYGLSLEFTDTQATSILV